MLTYMLTCRLQAAREQMEDRITAHKDAERDARSQGLGIRLDGKKATYKTVDEEDTKKTKQPILEAKPAKKEPANKSKLKSASGSDPWNLRSKSVENDYGEMLCPPLEMFFWGRLVVDEFHYLHDKSDRARVLSVVSKGLKASCRWALSGTTPHQDFDDVTYLAQLLGVHLGIEDHVGNSKANARKVR